MGDRLTKDYEMAIREALASCRGEGRSWSWGNAGPFATVDETAEALAQVARNADGGAAATNLWCVHMPDPNEPGMSLYVCHTGNGPTSQAHARFFAGAPNAVRMLLSELDALRAAPPTTYLHADGTEEPIGELVERLTREAGADRAARVVLGDSLRNEVTARLDAEERAQKAEARVRELEAEVQKAREAMGNGTDDSRWRPGESSVDALIRERDTERAARVATEELLRDVSENRAQIEDLAHELKDRVRELEAERDALAFMLRDEKAEATLAETRAQLARLRDGRE